MIKFDNWFEAHFFSIGQRCTIVGNPKGFGQIILRGVLMVVKKI
jgi:hypothetical protein